ncbi:MAG: cyanophycinase [Proteiniphilum sp.]|jgi:cyanophycinase|nr:cyanophycinase [Proteiniphilum sp.]
MKRILLFILIFGTGFCVYAQKPIAIDSALTTRHGPEKGSLIIIGGGNVVAEIWDRFIELAGGVEKARIVVVTNASGDEKEDYHSAAIDTLSRRLGKNRISRLHLKNIREANDEKNFKILQNATGIYFSGGRQWRIADVYLNTLTHLEFFNLLNRGGVIAGSSAGASIQGSFLWRGDTKGAQILIGDHTQGLGFLRNSIIDQHLIVRNRQFDATEFIKIAPQFIGIGLNESTAIVVQKDEFEVIGASAVAVYDYTAITGKGNNSSVTRENYYGTSNRPFFFLNKGQKYDLKEHKIIRERNTNRTNQTSN